MRTLLLLLSTLPFIAHAGQPATISGKPANFSEGNIVLYADKPYPQSMPDAQSYALSGNFEWKTELEYGTLLTATVGNEIIQFFLEPGDALTISFDPVEKPLSIEFSGKGAENNRLLQEFNIKFINDFSPSSIQSAMEASVDAFESQLFDQRMKQLRFMKEQSGKSGITQSFRDFLNHQITYHFFAQLLQFSISKSDDPTGMKVSRLPDIMLTEMNSLPLSDERGMNAPAYRSFVRNYIRYQTSAQNSFVKFADYSDMLEREYSYALRYLTGEPFTFWLANELFEYCDKSAPETVKKLHKALTQCDLTGDYAKPVTARCEAELAAKTVKKELALPEPEAKGKKGSGKSSDDAKKSQPFTLIDMKGNKVYLSDFKGKVLYVDFWASWCGPCRQQFPYAKELHKMFSPEHLKQVVFLYISIDNDEATWKKGVEKNQIQGFNVFSPGGWSSSVVQHFGVRSIPRYKLIDKQGNIADPNAKRPSSGQEIVNDIVRLIKQ